jgi:hypothetical protein
MASFYIAGSFARSRMARKVLEDAPIGTQVLLVPEPDNQFDSNAVKVMIGQAHVGYVPVAMQHILPKQMPAVGTLGRNELVRLAA